MALRDWRRHRQTHNSLATGRGLRLLPLFLFKLFAAATLLADTSRIHERHNDGQHASRRLSDLVLCSNGVLVSTYDILH